MVSLSRKSSLLVIILLAGFTACRQQNGRQSVQDPQKAAISTADSMQYPAGRPATAIQGSDSPGLNNELKSRDENVTNSREDAITRATKEVSPCVVSVSVTEVVTESPRFGYDPFFDSFIPPGRMRQFKSLGSGFLITPDGLIVTNQHVIGEHPSKIIVTISGKSYDATMIGSDKYTDIALLKIKADKKLPYVHFGNSAKAIVGEWCIAIGNPFGLFEDGQPTVTVGVISAVNRDFRPDPNDPRTYQNMLQTDAAINRGNSGGPLINSLGEVIGMNTFIYTGHTGGGFVGLGFAIPSNTIVRVVNQLEQNGSVALGFNLGFHVRPITLQTAYRYNLPLMQGVYVYSVNKDGPAYKAGILPGDILWRIGDERIYSYTHFQALLREHKKGDTVHFVIFRRGKFYEATMKLASKVDSKKQAGR